MKSIDLQKQINDREYKKWYGIRLADAIKIQEQFPETYQSLLNDFWIGVLSAIEK